MRTASRRGRLLLLTLVLFGAAPLSGCVSGGQPAGATVAGPDLRSAIVADGPPPDDPPSELLEERRPTRQADRLIEKTSQVKELCAALGEIDAIEEPRPHDPAELLQFTAQNLGIVRTIKEKSRVKNPDDRNEEMDLPEELWKDVLAMRKAMYAFSVRVAYVAALEEAGRIDEAEVRTRLDRANIALARSEYTTSYRRLVSVRPRYC